ncbi:hypothetical protein J4455_03000 [Candidatus Woesearchaeota archaeon]|nr:hypothetical protein [Candidatus Woesearchaeota archaeon]
MKIGTLLIIVLSALIIVTLLLIISKFQQIPKSSFTEIYFNDIENIPKIAKINQPIIFSFSVSNKQNKNYNYEYELMLKIGDNESIIKRDNFNLNKNEIKNIIENLTIKENFEKALISVKLIDTNQEIHFWVTNINKN